MNNKQYERQYKCDVCGEYVFSSQLKELVIGDIEIDICGKCFKDRTGENKLEAF